MIFAVRLYVHEKRLFELRVLKDSFFKDVERPKSISINQEGYPITSKNDGINIEIDKYRGFIIAFPTVIFNDRNLRKLKETKNLTYSHLCFCVNEIQHFIYQRETFKISQIQIAITVETPIPASKIIKENVLMHNYKYYNHNRLKNLKKEMKIFEYDEYAIELNANKKNSDKTHFLNLKLKLFKSSQFRKYGILSITDLLHKEKLENLFMLLKSKFNELQIIDSQYMNISNVKDKNLMVDFMGYDYWNRLRTESPKQTVSNRKKKFESLIKKYQLISLKEHLENKLDEVFEEIINN